MLPLSYTHGALPILAAMAVAAPQDQASPDPLPAPDAAITRAELEHHVRFLASDELGGRPAFSDSADRAAAYLARALEAAGVEPAGEEGGWFQDTGLERHVYPSVPRLFFTDEAGAEIEAKLGADFFFLPRGEARSTPKLPLRFFYDYNHSRMPLVGNPEEALYFSASAPDKRRILAEKGIETLTDWGLELEVLRGESEGKPGRAKDSFEPRIVRESAPEECDLVRVRGPLRPDFERRKFTHVELRVESVVAPFDDRNVVGRIRGAGTPERPELAQEVVLVSASYDHARLRAPVEGEDSIFNGADDDASGCAALLELAQALARGPKPARTLVFLFTSSEDEDSAGSRRYLADPPEPLERTVAALYLEHLGRPDPQAGGAGHLWLTGFTRSNLGLAWEERGLGISPDPRIKENYYRRFHARGLAEGGLLAHSLSSFGEDARHDTPDDEADTLDYAHLEAVTRKAFEAVGALADGSIQPAPTDRSEADEARRRKEEEARARLRTRRGKVAREPEGAEDGGADGDDGEKAEDG
jgi:hypothetical protein